MDNIIHRIWRKDFLKKNNNNKSFNSKNINLKIRINILKTNNYCEKTQKIRGAFETRCFRKHAKTMLNRPGWLTKKFRKDDCCGKVLQVLIVVKYCEKRRSEWIGHILRHSGGLLGLISEARVERKHHKDYGYNT